MSKMFLFLYIPLQCLLASASFAAETLPASHVGRWSPKQVDCGSDIVFDIEPKQFAYTTFSCEHVDYFKDGANWKGHGTDCSGEEGKIPPLNFTLILKGGAMQIDWLDGSKSDLLVRCKS